MTAKEIIRALTGCTGINKSEIAARTGSYPQKFQARIDTGKLSMSEWQQIAAAVDAQVQLVFIFNDGKSLTIPITADPE